MSANPPLQVPGEPESWLDYLRELASALRVFATHPRAVVGAAWAGFLMASWCTARHASSMPSAIPSAAAAVIVEATAPPLPDQAIAWTGTDGALHLAPLPSFSPVLARRIP